MSADPYDAVQDARSETRYEWTEGDVADDAAEAFRWGYLRERTTVEHQIWTADEQGREILVASTKIGSDAGVVFDAVKDARSFVEWRTAAHGQHKGRLFRGWDGEKGELYGPSMEANLA